MDKYIKLRPYLPTSDTEICKCIGRPPIVLEPHLTSNPIVCADCNLEVELNQLNFEVELIEEIANWRDFYFCFYYLWLDSAEFEEWAKQQLSIADSPVNKRALILKDKINVNGNECFYWWFIDSSSTDYKSFDKCPKCGGELTNRNNKFNTDTNICKNCGIIVSR